MGMVNESFIRCSDDLVNSCHRRMENGIEVVSFILDCFGTWVVTFYICLLYTSDAADE